MQTVVVLAPDDVIAFDLATAIEMFTRVRLPDERAGYRVLVAGAEREIAAGPMRIVVDHGLEVVERADLVVVPGTNDVLTGIDPRPGDALRDAAGRGARIASICVGAFALAATGLLDGLRATTHWRATDELARLFPRIEVDPDVLFTDNGQVLTSAGASAGLDLCLHIVAQDYGMAVAADASRLAVAPLQRSGGQAQYILRNRPLYQTATLERMLAWIEDNTHRPLTVADIAEAARTSVRTLSRRFLDETGQSPMQWVTGVRVRQAQELLETTDHTVDRIVRQVGFSSPGTFRALFKEIVGVTPSTYRGTFRPATPPRWSPARSGRSRTRAASTHRE